MTPIDVTTAGVALTSLPGVPEELRALVAATGAAEVTFRTRIPLGELLNDLADAMAGTRVRIGTWSVAAETLFRHLIRAAIPDGSEEGGVGVAFTYAGPVTVLVLVGATDAWRVGLAAEVTRPSCPGDLLVAIEPVAPPGVEVTPPPKAPARPTFKLLRGGG